MLSQINIYYRYGVFCNKIVFMYSILLFSVGKTVKINWWYQLCFYKGVNHENVIKIKLYYLLWKVYIISESEGKWSKLIIWPERSLK